MQLSQTLAQTDDGPDLQETAERSFDWLLGAPLQTLITIVAGVVLLAVARWLIARAVRSVVEGGSTVRSGARRLLMRTRISVPEHDALAITRRVKRAETMGSVLRSAAGLIVGIAVITALANIYGWDLGPVLASAGVAGVALGFGAQTLVKDFISGLFMLVEDQYGVGDVVDLGEAIGTVEEIGLRVTQVRDLSGTLWYVRNGEVLRVGNLTQGWSNAFIELLVPLDQDVERATELVRTAAQEVAEDEELAALVLDEPVVTGYEDLSAEAVKLRLMLKTAPASQWQVQRALRARIKDAFTAAQIPLALPRREILLEREATSGGARSESQGAADDDESGGGQRPSTA